MKISAWVLGLASTLLAGAVSAGHPANSTPHLRDDVVRDGRADIIFQGGTSLAYWTVAANGQVSSAYAGDGGAGYSVVAVSDFDGDRSADVLWTNGSHLKLWINDSFGGYTPVSVGNYGGGWVPFAAGDINGDGKSDLFFRGSTHLAYWLMDGPRVTASSYAGDGGAGWQVVAIDHFFYKTSTPNGSIGRNGVDVLWSNGSEFKFWAGDNTASRFYLISAEDLGVPESWKYGGGWEPFGAGDVDGNGIADILFRNGPHVAYWLIEDKWDHMPTPFHYTYELRYAGNVGDGFRPVAISHYDGDKSADVLWTNGSQIKLWRYENSSTGYVPSILGSYGGGWKPLEMLISGK